MPFALPDLPFPADALEPHMSKNTLGFHHGKHHATYVNTANDLVKGTPYDKMSLEEYLDAYFERD